jgi:hypothetical protein
MCSVQLQRLGSKCPFIGPEPDCGITVGAAKKAVRDCKNRGYKTMGILDWNRQRNTYQELSARITKELLSLNKSQ